MTITDTRLVRAAGVAAAVAGGIFIVVQIGHPASDAFTTDTAAWVARSWAKDAMAALALAGITGMYLRQHREAGILGLIGYVVFAAGYLTMFSVQVIAASVLPALVEAEPGFVDDVVMAAAGGAPAGDIGPVQTLLTLQGAGYLVGGLLFGVALFRTGILARWAALLLAASTAGTAALAVLPSAFDRPFAVPAGIALIALGASLWRSTGDLTTGPAALASVPVREPVSR